MENHVYEGKQAKEISFPIGGIGTGCIGLGGNGRLVDIEIFNRPNKGSHSGYTHFAIKAENDKEVVSAKVLNSDLKPGFMGQVGRPMYQGYGFGPDRASLAGLPHFESSKFTGTYPLAQLDFFDKDFPGDVKMVAFNPFIPSNDFDSSIPAGFFEFEITNTANTALTFSLAMSCNNYYAGSFKASTQGGQSDPNNYLDNVTKYNPRHEIVDINGQKGLYLTSDAPKNTTEYGDLTIVCDAKDTVCQQYWFRGNWFDNLTTYWNDFSSLGALKNRVYDNTRNVLDLSSSDEVATLMSRVVINPSETKKIRFIMSWSMPLINNHWIITDPTVSEEQRKEIRNTPWKNYYATQFETSVDSAKYSLENFDRLYNETLLFRDSIFNSTLPDSAIDAITANMSILKTPTCLRLTDGSFYAFEGCHYNLGSCEGTCTHVWAYTYALAFLFPALERSARTLEYKYSTDENGSMAFRVQLPLGRKSDFRACVDGQYATVMRVYREFMISGDVDWLKSIWEKVKKSIEFAWSPKNYDKWDADKDGVLEGRQHHTLDMELFGANSWLTGLYLGGLKAGAELAKILGEQHTHDEYMRIFESGKKKLNEELFDENLGYFIQKIDLKDKSILEKYSEGISLHGESAVDAYWNPENKEIKYQVAQGSSIDQVLGQWHADMLGLGNIFDEKKLESALNALYEHNFVKDMRNHVNPCRIYCLNDEKGLIICAYPDKVYRPYISVPYAEETMHGFEYQAAIHMIKRGMEEKGLECIKALRDRYDGERRNPWNEFECGSNYARSMASYALLLTYSGFEFDMYHKRLGFNPIHKENATFFWSVDNAWGTISFNDEGAKFAVLHGSLELKSLSLPFSSVCEVKLENQSLKYAFKKNCIEFESIITIQKDELINVFS